MIELTRRATFSSSHYYWNDEWTAEKNEQVFGRCARRNGHGHNYTLEVTVAGEPDPVTGFVVDLKWLKDVMEQKVLAAYDHRHLNLEVPEFAGSKLIPTTENIAIAAWKRLEPSITAAGGARLTCVRIYETPEIFAEYRGPIFPRDCPNTAASGQISLYLTSGWGTKSAAWPGARNPNRVGGSRSRRAPSRCIPRATWWCSAPRCWIMKKRSPLPSAFGLACRRAQ